MGIPLLFTVAGTATAPTQFFEPWPGLYPSDELFPGEDIFPDDGPTLDFYAVAPQFDTFGVDLAVDPVAATFDGGAVTFAGLDTIVVTVDPSPATFVGGDADLSGLPETLAVDPVAAVFNATAPGTSGGQLLILIPSVRELPPLRLSLGIETPAGNHYRWGEDEPNPSNVPNGLRFSDTMPGGFETQDATLPRRPGSNYPDLERLSTVRVYGAGGELAWEGRLERAPQVSGDTMSISPAAVGYQAELDDDKSAQMIYIDRDLGRWGQIPVARRLLLTEPPVPTGYWLVNEASVTPADATARPTLSMSFRGSWLSGHPLVEAWYDAGGCRIGLVSYAWRKSASIGLPDPNWVWGLALSDNVPNGGDQVSGNLASPGPGSGLMAASTTTRRYAFVQFYYQVSPAGGEVDYTIDWTALGVFGDHGLPRQPVSGTDPTPGLLASDVVRHAVSRWAPRLKTTSTTVSPSAFVIPHLAFLEPTTASEIIKGATKFGLQDWAVWDDRTFWWHDRGARGRKWRTRVGPSQLEETGPQLDRLFESVIVQYQDVDGTTKTAGPPGSRSDIESATLRDPDPENPANKAGIVRRALLVAGTTVAAGAVEIGRRFLQEQKLLDRSGRCQIVGHVEDDRGVKHPYWAVRAGDYITFVDSNDTSYRRIVRTDKDHASRTCSLDLDAPPEGLQVLLERLSVDINPLGL